MCHCVYMNTVFATLKRFYYKIQDFKASPLPVGLTEFNDWCDRLLFTYFPKNAQPPLEDSFRFSVAAMVLHLDSQSAKVSNRFFGKAIVKGAANEVASFVMQDLKAKRDALIKQQEAEHLRRALESTPTQTEAEATAPQAQDGPQQ